MYFDDMKIVEFDKYCSYCKNRDTHESEEPCCECLATPVIENSHKPLYFEESLTMYVKTQEIDRVMKI